MNSIIEKAKSLHQLSKNEIILLLENNSINDNLFKAADEIREKHVGAKIHLRALIEFSNICKRNCKYCGIRIQNKNTKRFRLSPNEILNLSERAVQKGFKTIVLQSAEDDYYNIDILGEILRKIKKNDIAITLSIGERKFEEYKMLKESGADRFLLRIETTDKELYKKLHPGMSYENREDCLKNLKNLGYETGTGCLVGLPGQTTESLANDILFFKELNADMVGIGPLIPHKDTPLKNTPANGFLLFLKVIAMTRLLMPDINIPATTAMETLQKNGRIIALQSGANVVMPNINDNELKTKYDIYPGKAYVDYSELEKELKLIGRTISKDKGFRVK